MYQAEYKQKIVYNAPLFCWITLISPFVQSLCNAALRCAASPLVPLHC
jgi:hypothetical protein